MRRERFIIPVAISLLAIVLLGLVACRPTTPAPAPAAPQAAATPSAVAGAAPIISPQEAEWAKIVAAAKKEGTVTAYAGTWTGDVGMAMAQGLKDRYGIKLEILTGKGADFMERLKVEKRVGQYVADVNQGSQASMSRVMEEGLSVPLKGMAFPIFQEKGVWAVDPFDPYPEGYAMIVAFSPQDVWVNTKLVPTAEEPKSFRELLLPKWKGKMVIADPVINSGPYMNFITLVNRKALDWEYVKALGNQDLKLARTTAEMFSSLARGDAHIVPVGAAQVGTRLIWDGAPIKPVPAEEGTVATAAGVSIIKNAPHPNAAKVLTNWLLSQEGQTVFTKAISISGPRTDVPDFRPPAARVSPKKLFFHTEEDEAVKMMRDRFIPNLWKQ